MIGDEIVMGKTIGDEMGFQTKITTRFLVLNESFQMKYTTGQSRLLKLSESFRTKYTAGQSGLLRLSEEFPDEIHYQTVRTLKLSESFQTKNMTRLLKWNEETLPGLPGLRNGHLKKKGMLPEVFYFFL
ncbi:uncharacterized protein OCT59_007893 [Rhizophagus irregularis]|uniref:uncharacterized protein n=1 Tax=Rhizophagus irregularis TaxID=588596 RepID=UPI0033273064|nr:hypothetical protein OCT59_007893 [Rhizophagus irregularis]